MKSYFDVDMIDYIEVFETQEKNLKFPCTSCGLCCKKIGITPEFFKLNRGDGICRYFNDDTNLCSIYENRPIVCRIEDYYRKYLSELYKWDDFVAINLKVCDTLQKDSTF